MPRLRWRRSGCRTLHAALIASALLLLAPTPVLADATVFVGSTITPANRPAIGLALGAGLLVVGFEFEFSSTGESQDDAAPSLRTGMANVLLQTPVPIAGMQLYFTTGTGVYRERLDTHQETNVGFNTGGGAKISLLGPIRARLDYRLFTLRGESLHSPVHRIYAGLNLQF